MKKSEKEQKEVWEELDELHKKIWNLSQFVKIIFKGHETERKHKNIYKKCFNLLTQLSSQEKK